MRRSAGAFEFCPGYAALRMGNASSTSPAVAFAPRSKRSSPVAVTSRAMRTPHPPARTVSRRTRISFMDFPSSRDSPFVSEGAYPIYPRVPAILRQIIANSVPSGSDSTKAHRRRPRRGPLDPIVMIPRRNGDRRPKRCKARCKSAGAPADHLAAPPAFRRLRASHCCGDSARECGRAALARASGAARAVPDTGKTRTAAARWSHRRRDTRETRR